MTTWQGDGVWTDSTETVVVQIKINPFGISAVKNGQEFFFTKDEFRALEISETGVVKIEAARAGIKTLIAIDSIDAAQTMKANRFDVKPKPILTLSGWILVVSAGLLTVLMMFFTIGADWLSGSLARLIPVSAEAQIGQTFFEQTLSHSPINRDSATVAVLDKCARTVEGFSNGRAYSFRVVIVEDSIKNAFALPGGYIVVYRGILDMMDNQDELFGLLSHESGHVYLQHGFKRIIRSALIGISVAVIFGDVGGISAILLDNSQSLLNLAHDRGEESAADNFGFEVLTKKGADTFGIVTLFEKLDNADGDAQLLSFLSTHPETRARVTELRKKQPRHSSKKFLSDAEWRQLKQK
jgi:Zn-dependent protease with chaperone function